MSWRIRPSLRFWQAVAVLLGSLALWPGLSGVVYGLRSVPRGVNDAGAEFDGASRRGGPLQLSSPGTLQALARRNFAVVRLPLRWESLQPNLDGPLDPQALASLRGYLQQADGLHLQVILDLHNGARYSPQAQGPAWVIGDPHLPISSFAGFWQRLSQELKATPAIYAYGLMNEPHDIVTRTWEQASQAAVDAIRSNGDRHLILVSGSNYSSCSTWVMCHEREAWVHDPVDHLAYEAHLYFDRNGSAQYRLSFAEEAALDPQFAQRALQHLNIFVQWCQENAVQGFIGELGCPADPQWCAYLDRVLGELDRVHMGAAAWAAGERWPADYPLYVRDSSPQMAIWSRHPGGWTGTLLGDWCLGYQMWTRRALFLARKLRHGWRPRQPP